MVTKCLEQSIGCTYQQDLQNIEYQFFRLFQCFQVFCNTKDGQIHFKDHTSFPASVALAILSRAEC